MNNITSDKNQLLSIHREFKSVNNNIVQIIYFNLSHRVDLKVSDNEHYEILVVQLDNTVSSDLKIELVGKNSSIKVCGLSLCSSGNEVNNNVEIRHTASDCKSTVLYKSVLIDKSSKYIWNGNVIIGSQAFNTVSYEENRNLLLEAGAKVTSIPNLEILTGKIEKAGHASSTSRLEDEQMFYLASRGIDNKSARMLVVSGFLSQVLDEFSFQNDININKDDIKELIGELLRN